VLRVPIQGGPCYPDPRRGPLSPLPSPTDFPNFPYRPTGWPPMAPKGATGLPLPHSPSAPHLTDWRA
jgi:hypothetical protein